MPLIKDSSYKPAWYLFNRHLETMVPSMTRKISCQYKRQRLELSDGDFVDLDWCVHDMPSRKLVIISHGLEGSSTRHYCAGTAKYFYDRGWDALSWNCRSCSGELNRLPRFYHHGDTEDLSFVIDLALSKGYSKIALVGFSMGGSFSLKYLGERGNNAPSAVVGAATFSVPCHLPSSAAQLDAPGRGIYRNRFLKKLRIKVEAKSQLFPDVLSAKDFEEIHTFKQFDDRYTAPLHGFRDAADFYSRCSCDQYLAGIAVPALIVNALNDPFLTKDCYPTEVASRSPHVFLETPARGGHVGFSLAGREENFMETRAYEFLEALV